MQMTCVFCIIYKIFWKQKCFVFEIRKSLSCASKNIHFNGNVTKSGVKYRNFDFFAHNSDYCANIPPTDNPKT